MAKAGCILRELDEMSESTPHKVIYLFPYISFYKPNEKKLIIKKNFCLKARKLAEENLLPEGAARTLDVYNSELR